VLLWACATVPTRSLHRNDKVEIGGALGMTLKSAADPHLEDL
jgi:hypothetical protein